MLPRLLFAAALAGMTFDLDVGIPPGSPLDYVRMPVETPARRDVPTPSPRPGPGETRTQDRLPRPFMPLDRPLTIDFEGHLQWTPTLDGTPTESGGEPMTGYPPEFPRALYLHCCGFYLMVMLHPSQVNEREILSYLIEIGEPSAYAGSAAKGEPMLSDMVKHVMDATGNVASSAPAVRGRDKIEKAMTEELVRRFPYEDKFGEELLKLPEDVALPALIKIAEKSTHRFLARNAVFALRAYDHPDVLPILRRALKSKDKVVRNRALAGLIRWRDGDCVPWLIDQLDGSDVPFRNYAARALGLIGDRRGAAPLLRAMKHPDWEFLWTAIPAYAQLGDDSNDGVRFLESLRRRLSGIEDPEIPPWPRRPDRADPEGTRRRILEERIDMALAFLKDRNALQGMSVHRANQNILKDYIARATPPPPPPPPGPAPEARPAPKPAPHALWETLRQYTGVLAVEERDGRLLVRVAAQADADDLRLLLGPILEGHPLEIAVE